jgi:hypothetical protein
MHILYPTRNAVLGGIYPKFAMLAGWIPMAWEGGKKIDGGSILQSMNLWYNQATPLMQSACNNAVGARKVYTAVLYVHTPYSCDTDKPVLCFEGDLDANQASVHPCDGHVYH